MKSAKKHFQITPEADRLMRLIANHMIDRMLEDKKNGILKFKPNKKRVNQKGNTT